MQKAYLLKNLGGNGPRLERDKQTVLNYLAAVQSASRSQMVDDLGIPVGRLRGILTVLKLQDEKICNIRGKGAQVWALGKPTVIESNKYQEINTFIKNVRELPEHLALLLGFTTFTPPPGRYIAESMPNIPIRKSSTHIGNGTFSMINSLENL